MFGGFDPSGEPDRSFFERRRWQSLVAAVLLVGGSLSYAYWLASREEPVVEEEEIIDAEVQNFEMEEEPEPEPEPEPPPPEPPSADPTPRKTKPTPAPDIQNVDKADENPEEGDVNTEGQTAGGGGGNDQRSDGDKGQKPEPKPEPKPAAEDKPKPKPKKLEIDDTKPIERPEEATVPKKIGGDPIAYPEDLKKRNVTGKVKVKLTIYKDGSVKGAKVLAKQNSVSAEDEPELAELANKLFLKAVQKALPTWKYEPSKYKGKPITVYLTITIPFDLN